jgi:hypothetical protein
MNQLGRLIAAGLVAAPLVASLVPDAPAAAETAAGATSPDFERDVLPLLYSRCFACHSGKKEEPAAGMRLDTASGILDSGAVVAGKPDESELLARVSLPISDEHFMPPLKGGGQPLSEAERDLLRRWIAAGAPFGSWQAFEHREPAIEFAGSQLSRADVPTLARQVDGLVDAWHATQGTRLNPPIDDEAFLRRVYLDVAGRIPSLAETRRFFADGSTGKRARLIDELLDGPGYVSHTFNWKADLLRLIGNGIAGTPGWMYDEWVKESVQSGMPYDEFVRRLVTSSGYPWDDGAVGFYLRDLGMPLDHTSNMARVFLGTRIECAQCHDHPHEPVTQQDFYQLSAYTFGVTNLCSTAGFSSDNVRHWKALQAKLKDTQAGEDVRQAASRTVAVLKRLTKDTANELVYPKDYALEPACGTKAGTRTPFGDEAPAAVDNRREALAAWMTSPRNPRFSRNIANRLWKQVLGVGLVEPVDSLSPMTRPAQPELFDFLAETMARLGFNERAFLAVVLNTRLYQSGADDEPPAPGQPSALRGPLMRRLSAEQVWDSLLTLLVEDLDERKTPNDHTWEREEYHRLATMGPDELLARSRVMSDFFRNRRENGLQRMALLVSLDAARRSGNSEEERRLDAQLKAVNRELVDLKVSAGVEPPARAKEADPRWSRLNSGWVRASELAVPVPLGHFLRQLGQSDRREIDAFSRDAKVTHALSLMNGDLTGAVVAPTSLLMKSLATRKDRSDRILALYQAILVRSPTDEESRACLAAWEAAATPERDIAWALVNTPEFLFVQ